MNVFINLGIYQAIWFICVFGGDSLAWVGLPLIAVHLFLSPYKKADLMLIPALLVIGLILDGALQILGFFSFNSDQFPIPYWLMVIWLALATLPNHSLRWLQSRPLLSCLLGALGGPLAYWAGVRFEAAHFNWPLFESILVLAVTWGLLWPLVMLLSRLSVTVLYDQPENHS